MSSSRIANAYTRRTSRTTGSDLRSTQHRMRRPCHTGAAGRTRIGSGRAAVTGVGGGLAGRWVPRWPGGVRAAGGTGPGEISTGVLPKGPSGPVLEAVVVTADGGQVVPARGTGRVRRGVVDVAAVSGLPAAGEPARDVPAADEVRQGAGRPVTPKTGVDHGAAVRCGQPAPQTVGRQPAGHRGRDGTDPSELARLVSRDD